ncbi:hypothetical protein L1S34_14405 [Flavobacterium sp. K77]|uniref:hypothetical protein n=1 Tax=Flavobacterium sp. K77 TaxID=2910676 RepID=UPI001F19F8CE|nr:hypothetical protein [Flavobacterium sp. K77]MCF6142484.1 hypothetical protein [Flavobacterium sp. K77]
MNKLIYFIICFTITLQSCNGQTTPKKEIYNKNFNWTITIPENFQNVSAEEWAKLQNKGAEAIEKTYEEEVINQSKIIFVFKSDQFNYFESNYQPFDISIDGDYLESCKNVNDILYETFKAQMPNIKIDTTKTAEKIDDLEFQTFKMKIEYPNKMVLNVLMYSRLFDKKEFSVNIMYVDNKKGQLMLEAWKKSKFTK